MRNLRVLGALIRHVGDHTFVNSAGQCLFDGFSCRGSLTTAEARELV
jgi:hypothetical protein